MEEAAHDMIDPGRFDAAAGGGIKAAAEDRARDDFVRWEVVDEVGLCVISPRARSTDFDCVVAGDDMLPAAVAVSGTGETVSRKRMSRLKRRMVVIAFFSVAMTSG